MNGSRTFRSLALVNFHALFLILALIVCQQAMAKEHKTVGSTIVINAPPEVCFEAVRKQRNSPEQHRTLEKFDGKVAVIKEKLEGVPIYGKVECVWQETEEPYKRIDYKMVSSTKFKEGFGSWIFTPSADGKSTTLQFNSYTDSGLMVPFGGELTKIESMKTSRIRLAHIREVAEEMEKHGGLRDVKSAERSEKHLENAEKADK